MKNETKQTIAFLLGQAKGEILRAFKEKRISENSYDQQMKSLVDATDDFLGLKPLSVYTVKGKANKWYIEDQNGDALTSVTGLFEGIAVMEFSAKHLALKYLSIHGL